MKIRILLLAVVSLGVSGCASPVRDSDVSGHYIADLDAQGASRFGITYMRALDEGERRIAWFHLAQDGKYTFRTASTKNGELGVVRYSVLAEPGTPEHVARGETRGAWGVDQGQLRFSPDFPSDAAPEAADFTESADQPSFVYRGILFRRTTEIPKPPSPLARPLIEHIIEKKPNQSVTHRWGADAPCRG